MDKQKIKLSARLAAIADMVYESEAVADIGTDHAYLPVYLVQSGRVKKAYACDVRRGPLENAESTIDSFNLGDKIETVLANGLSGLTLCELRYIIIAGMGGELIADILEARRSELHDQELILQPMTNIDILRRYLAENNFQIVDERIACEQEKIYIIIKAIPHNNERGYHENYNEFDYIIGKRIIENDVENREIYIRKLQEKYTEIYRGLLLSKNISKEDRKVTFAYAMLARLSDILNDITGGIK